VLIPFGHSPDYDLVAEIGGELVRVQVKTSTRFDSTSSGQERWSVAVRTNGGNQSWTGVAKLFDPAKVDALFVLVGNGRRWFIPASAVEGSHSLRLGGPKYSECEIDPGPAIEGLVYGPDQPTLESEPRPGECPSGQREHAVNVPAMPTQVRILPPPSKPTDALTQTGDTTKFERALGRSGQALVRPKRQTTIPKRAFADAGLRVGDRMRVSADGVGRIVFERIEPASEPLRLLSDGGEHEPL
jgi:PD-(D/E)XK endonuclease